ncbi:MAG: hypothetical protein AABY07_01605, partial [Nanoarchaeota archaeon]
AITNDIPFTCFIGEPLRIATILPYRSHKREIERQKELLKFVWESHEKVSDLADKIRNEGEEWKDRN